MIKPYLIDIRNRGNLALFISISNEIVVYDEEYDEYLKYPDLKYISSENVHHIAHKKELQNFGLWELVINKEDFSCIEDELDEYLSIGEEIEKKREQNKEE